MADRVPGWRLSPRQRKVTLLVHIVSGIGWMGADIVLFLLLLTGLTTDDGAVAAACYIAVGVFVPVAVPVFCLGMLGSGVLLGWGSKWGLLRYWWVTIKLAFALIMTVLVFVSLVPGINDLAQPDATASADTVRDTLGSAPTELMYPAVVSFTMLGIATVLSIFKPWGRTRWSAPAARQMAGQAR